MSSKKRIALSIKLDPVSASDYLKYDFRHACEHCVHFQSIDQKCTLGLNTRTHLLAEQTHQMEVSGRMALCRFMEVD